MIYIWIRYTFWGKTWARHLLSPATHLGTELNIYVCPCSPPIWCLCSSVRGGWALVGGGGGFVCGLLLGGQARPSLSVSRVQDPSRHTQPALGLAAEFKEKGKKKITWLPPKIEMLAISNCVSEFHLG